jgi:hypothetical protein
MADACSLDGHAIRLCMREFHILLLNSISSKTDRSYLAHVGIRRMGQSKSSLSISS